jgi:transposase
MKIFMDEEKLKVKERKLMYSTSLPKGLKVALEEAATLLHRKKADWVRTALTVFFALSEKDQELLILNSYNKIEKTQLRPFTTTLSEGQLISLNALSKSLKRSKVEIFRAAIFNFLSKTAQEQEKVIKKSLSR